MHLTEMGDAAGSPDVIARSAATWQSIGSALERRRVHLFNNFSIPLAGSPTFELNACLKPKT
jgi:hypothetical protein